VNKLRRRLVVT